MADLKPGDWLCPSCGDHQFARNLTCRKCGATKDGVGTTSGSSSTAAAATAAATAAAGDWGPYGAVAAAAAGGAAAAANPEMQMMMTMMQAMMGIQGASAANYAAWQAGSWETKPEKPLKVSGMPDIVMLNIAPSCAVVMQGYPAEVIGIPFEKSLRVFSDAHDILQGLLIEHDTSELIQYHHDPECEAYPEVYNAWKAAGREDQMQTVAIVPQLKTWAVGFGGKVNATRAVKLALSLTIAALVDPKRLAETTKMYPEFASVVAGMIS